jgi:hypothetical protein
VCVIVGLVLSHVHAGMFTVHQPSVAQISKERAFAQRAGASS